ncbi:hypothetical protein HMPREF9622_02291 [Cutibacterium modestum HL037PA3]|uniref:Uncharacterized protein n=1 Tax=Cutibacterium modestum HL044PA1 TaxID=765109 RepID=A0ABP2K904_9ACTN|nr:hypothetical protein HMPREF9607_00353 [Cutibacterium modestum HL044PA1]EFT14721.1 hypothetical protein HMPREF9622_02291 [Cutibacterium modestum HL037PA3]
MHHAPLDSRSSQPGVPHAGDHDRDPRGGVVMVETTLTSPRSLFPHEG